MPKRKPLPLFPEPEYQVSEIELHYIFKGRASERPKITCSDDAQKILRPTWNPNTIELREEFKVMYLNRAGYVISMFKVSQGGIAGTCVEPRHIVVAGMLQNASGIILAHNHPSGSLIPSQADKDITRKVQYTANIADMTVQDHIILTRDHYFSLADEGMMPL